MSLVYLLWALLNIAGGVTFLVIGYKAIKLVRQHIGMLAAIFFVIGLLSFGKRNDDPDEDTDAVTHQAKQWTFFQPDSLRQDGSYFTTIDLEKTIITRYSLVVSYGKDSAGNNVPVSGYMQTSGLITGIKLKAVSVVVNQSNRNDRFEYEVSALRDWRLMNMGLYVQPVHFKGVALI